MISYKAILEIIDLSEQDLAQMLGYKHKASFRASSKYPKQKRVIELIFNRKNLLK